MDQMSLFDLIYKLETDGPDPTSGFGELIHEAARRLRNLATENERLKDKCDDLKETVEDMAHQFAYHITKGGHAAYTAGGLSALEGAFRDLGWDDPHFIPEYECQIDGCGQYADCGVNTPDGYKRVCTDHCRAIERENRK